MDDSSKSRDAILEFINDYPVCEYFFLKTSELTLTPAVKLLAQQDAAAYGERRNIPTAPDSFEECKAIMEQYSDAFLFDAVYEVDDAYDIDRCKEVRKEHAALIHAVSDEFRQRFGKILTLSISCDLCEDCPCPQKPCRYPEKQAPTMDSYGVQIMKTLADRDIMYDYGIHMAIYFTLILWNGEA
jgi:predicted metal-binding protein